MMTTKLKLKPNLRSHGSRLKFNLEKLKDPEAADLFEATNRGKFAALNLLKENIDNLNLSICRRIRVGPVGRWTETETKMNSPRNSKTVMCVNMELTGTHGGPSNGPIYNPHLSPPPNREPKSPLFQISIKMLKIGENCREES